MTKRIIARLDIKGDNVVRGIHMEGLRIVGRPEEMAERYRDAGVDEIIFIDTVATLYGRSKILEVVERTAENIFIPLTVGGGIRSARDVGEVLRAGADKVTINSAAVRNPDLISDLAQEFGSQCVIVAIEVKREMPGKWTVLIENGRESTGVDALEWAQRCGELGAGEVLVTSIDMDGTRKGCDIALTLAIAERLSIPVIASGGPGTIEHVAEAFEQGHADAIALGSLLHFDLCDVSSLKNGLANTGLDIRPTFERANIACL